jgi:hypothetical protein
MRSSGWAQTADKPSHVRQARQHSKTQNSLVGPATSALATDVESVTPHAGSLYRHYISADVVGAERCCDVFDFAGALFFFRVGRKVGL